MKSVSFCSGPDWKYSLIVPFAVFEKPERPCVILWSHVTDLFICFCSGAFSCSNALLPQLLRYCFFVFAAVLRAKPHCCSHAYHLFLLQSLGGSESCLWSSGTVPAASQTYTTCNAPALGSVCLCCLMALCKALCSFNWTFQFAVNDPIASFAGSCSSLAGLDPLETVCL